MVGQQFVIDCEALTTIGLFAAGHIERDEAATRLGRVGHDQDEAATILDCVDFVGIEVAPA